MEMNIEFGQAGHHCYIICIIWQEMWIGRYGIHQHGNILWKLQLNKAGWRVYMYLSVNEGNIIGLYDGLCWNGLVQSHCPNRNRFIVTKTSFSDILIKMQPFTLEKIYSIMSSAK